MATEAYIGVRRREAFCKATQLYEKMGELQENMQLTGAGSYIPILFFIVLATQVAVVMLVVGIIWRPKHSYDEKLSPYECGVEPTGDAWERVIPRYYVYAMLFLAFEVETLFLFPWAIVFDKIGLFAFIEMVLFIIILVIGLVYAWAKGALDWHY